MWNKRVLCPVKASRGGRGVRIGEGGGGSRKKNYMENYVGGRNWVGPQLRTHFFLLLQRIIQQLFEENVTPGFLIPPPPKKTKKNAPVEAIPPENKELKSLLVN